MVNEPLKAVACQANRTSKLLLSAKTRSMKNVGMYREKRIMEVFCPEYVLSLQKFIIQHKAFGKVFFQDCVA